MSENESRSDISDLCEESGLPDIAGIPIPPQVQRSLWKAISQLILGLADVPAAYLESKARSIRSKSEGQSGVTLAAAQVAAEQFGKSPELANRALHHFASKIIQEQSCRESVAKAAIEELRDSEEMEDAQSEIDGDWLALFADIAAKKSSAELQVLLGKILAGEIRKPGSFSPATIQLLSTLTPDIAQRFQALCEISLSSPFGYTFIIFEPIPNLATHGSDELGISYHDLMTLQTAGLLPPSLANSIDFHSWVGKVALDFHGDCVAFVPAGEEAPQLRNTKVMLLSSVGHELRQIIALSGNPDYDRKLHEWLGGKNVALRPARQA